MRIVDWLLRRDARLAKRIAEGIGLNRVSSVRDVNGWDEIAAYARETDGVYEEGGIWLHVTPGGVSQIMCPRCWNGGGGTLSRITMKGSDDVFYLCDECDALWPAEQFDWDNYTVGLTDRASALEARGLSADDLRPVLKDLSLFETAGEDYRLVMYYRRSLDPNDALRAIWSWPPLSGPMSEQGGELREPWCVPDVDEAPFLRGLLALPQGVNVGCFSYCVVGDEGIDLVFGIPLVQLGRVWPDALDEEHFGGEWELSVEELLLELATHVFACAPFRRALTGVEVGACPEELEPPQPLPFHYGLGIIEPLNGELTWHPPTERSWPD